MPRSWWCFFLVAALMVGLARAAFAAPPTISTPVTDAAGAIDAEDEERIASALVQLKNGGGPQMAVVFVRTTEGQPIEDYTLRVAEAWGGGSKELENGVVLLFAIDDRRSRLEVGYGLEAKIPDAKARALLDGKKDDLRAERYGDAALAVIRNVATTLGKPAPAVAARKTPYPAKPSPRPDPGSEVPAAPVARGAWWQTAPMAGLGGYLAGILAGALGTLLLRRAPPRDIPLENRTDDELMKAIRTGPPTDWNTLARWAGAILCLLVVIGAGAIAFPPAAFVPFGGVACVMGFVAALVVGRRESPLKALAPAPIALVWGFAGNFMFAFEGLFSSFFGSVATFIMTSFFSQAGGSTSIGSGSVRYRTDADEVRSFFSASASDSSSSSSSSSSFGSSSSGSSFGSSSSSSSSSTNWSGGGGGFGGGGASSSW